MSDDFGKNVEAGVKAGATGAAIAGGAAAIGAAAGASLGPFAVIAAPIGAAVGALIGFFISLGGGPSEEEKRAAAQKSAELGARAREATALLAFDTIQLGNYPWGSPPSLVFVGQLQAIAEQHPTWADMINGYIKAARDTKSNPPNSDPSFKKTQDFIVALANMNPSFAADPFVYLRPPLSSVFGPALAAVGINISDPSVLAMMRGAYEKSVSAPRVRMSFPITRASLNAKSGGRVAYDKRAFSSLAPYGVGSFKMFPETAPDPSWTTDDDHGNPLSAPWPYGLDADNFAKPPPTTTKAAKVAKVAIPAAVVALLFFL